MIHKQRTLSKQLREESFGHSLCSTNDRKFYIVDPFLFRKPSKRYIANDIATFSTKKSKKKRKRKKIVKNVVRANLYLLHVQTVCSRCSHIIGHFWEKNCPRHNQHHMQEYKEGKYPSYFDREDYVPLKSPERLSPSRHHHDWHLRLASGPGPSLCDIGK